MGKEKKTKLLEEKKELSREEILSKIKRLDGYIKKSERRLKMHEKAVEKLREKMRKEIQKTMKGILRGKIYG